MVKIFSFDHMTGECFVTSRQPYALCNNRHTLEYLLHFVIKLSHFGIPPALCNYTSRTF